MVNIGAPVSMIKYLPLKNIVLLLSSGKISYLNADFTQPINLVDITNP
jgi:hypothetical protein